MTVSLAIISALLLGAPHLSAFGQRVEVSESERLSDVVVIDGRVDVRGMVEGHLYALDSDVFIRKEAAVLQSLTVFGGSLHLEDGAVLPKRIDVWSIDFYGPNQEALRAGGTVTLPNGSMVAALAEEQIASGTHELTKAVLRFDRAVPAPGATLESVGRWQPGFGLEAAGDRTELNALEIGGLLRLRFVSDRVVGAIQRGFKGSRGAARLTAVELDSFESAAGFWRQIARSDARGQVSATVKSDLGDGAHWFFLRRGRATTIWQRGRWVLAMESTLFAQQASNLQHHQFNRQLVSSLEGGFGQSETAKMSQGAVP